jgi:hypothetical protein
MTSPQDQFADRGHRTQENFKRLCSGGATEATS